MKKTVTHQRLLDSLLLKGFQVLFSPELEYGVCMIRIKELPNIGELPDIGAYILNGNGHGLLSLARSY